MNNFIAEHPELAEMLRPVPFTSPDPLAPWETQLEVYRLHSVALARQRASIIAITTERCRLTSSGRLDPAEEEFFSAARDLISAELAAAQEAVRFFLDTIEEDQHVSHRSLNAR